MTELQDVNIFDQKKHLIENSFSTINRDLHPVWIDDCLGDAAHFYLITKEAKPKPYVVILETFGGKLSKADFFVIEEHCSWKIRCLLFESNEKKNEWINAIGEDKVIKNFSV